MKKFKGTKGEWRVRFMTISGENDGECDMFIEADEPKNNIGKIEIMMDDCGSHNGYPREQKMADARLISASPELLDALQLNIDKIQLTRDRVKKNTALWHELDNLYEVARIAINKALGIKN